MAADGSGPKNVTETLYFRGMDGDRTAAGGWNARRVTIDDAWDHAITDAEALAGQPARTFTWDGPKNPGGTNWLSATRLHYSHTQTGSYYMVANPTIYASRVREIEKITQTVLAGPTYRLSQVQTEYEDTYGLPITVTDVGDTATGSDDRCTSIKYTDANTARWIIGLPRQTLVDNCAGSPTAADVLSGSRLMYDGLTYGQAPLRGLVTKTKAIAGATAYPPAGGDWITTSNSSYDAYGRVLDVSDALDRKTSTAYIPAAGGPVTGVAVTDPKGWTATTNLDPRFGVPTKMVDVNGKATTAQYDAHGRLTKVWKHNRPANTTPDMEYVYTIGGPNSITTKVLGTDGQQISSVALFDGHLRPRQTQTPSAGGTGRTISDTSYDGMGRVAKQSTFYNSSAPNLTIVAAADKDIPVQHRYTYDNPGRQTTAQRWTGDGTTSTMLWQTSYAYDGDKYVRTTPPAGGTATTVVNDVRGKTVELRQHMGGTPAGAVDTTTRYTYDRLDQLTKVTDTGGNIWTYEYDLLGRKFKTVDPDAGASTSVFDNAGQVVSTADARGQKLYFEYDLLGRKTKQRDGSPTGPVMAAWVYDTYDKGQLAESIRYTGADQYTTRVTSRDDAYRPLHTEVVVPNATVNGALAGTYAWDYTYKVNGAPATTSLPGVGGLPSETLTHGYDALGQPVSLTSGQTTYLGQTDYTYDGLIYQQLLGEPGKQIDLWNSIDASTRRPFNAYVYTENPATPGGWDEKNRNQYEYDPAGNITLIGGMTNGYRDQVECFRYDHLRRLTEAWTQTTVGEGCTTPKREGTDPYWRQWTFDDLGNRLTQVDKNPSAGDTTWTYHVGTPAGVKPHQLKQVNATGPQAGTPTRVFGYDPAGNMTSATTATGATQTLTWDAEGHLATITEGANATSSYIVIKGQYRPCPSCRGKMGNAARTNSVTIVYTWNGNVWVATPSSSGARYGRAIRAIRGAPRR